MNIIDILVKELGLKKHQIEAAITLIDEGNTVPFIARYRKEATGEMTDVQLRDLDHRLEYLRSLESRKEDIKRLIDEQGKRSEEHTSELQSRQYLVCRLLLEKK